MITTADVETRLAGLDAIGRRETGFHRLAWTDEDRAAAAWFAEQAAALELRVERDLAGNLWACPDAPPPWWGVGSHLDTVAGGGRYDGALGVACAFAIAAETSEPVAVVSFADEEGGRYNTPTFGSRALVGRLDVDDVLARADGDGVTMADAMRAAGVDPERLRDAPSALERLQGFLEIHIDQSRELEEADTPIGVVTALAGRMRVAVEIDGEADHAGTTRRGERRDALAAAARLIVAAEDLAAPNPAFVVTPTRLLVEPNALSTIPGSVRLWLDARAPDVADVDAWRAGLEDAAADVAEQRRVAIRLATASRSAGVVFDAGVRAALARGAQVAQVAQAPAPEMVCFAGHDAGVIGERLPAGMVLVRNPTGVSHSPAEEVAVADAAVAARAVAAALEELA
ncbi:MAG TPA: hydantoinase/carbamoylase family amidase [Baekduia sp.]|nr:hydantoinase/carbamoylase family amidase [Baekduia sp.]